MARIIYKKMSLFDAPPGSLLVHACNAQGVWGSGIAVEFKRLFPKAFEEYNNHCRYHDESLMFPTLITQEEKGYRVGCLITSENYGNQVSSVDDILWNTTNALDALGLLLQRPENKDIQEIYSNKFNSGLFKVPWEKTEDILMDELDYLKRCFNLQYNWTVCDPNLKG